MRVSGQGAMARSAQTPSLEHDFPGLLTVTEVAALLRVNPKTVHRLRRSQGLPCLRVGGQLRFDRSEIVRWLSARKEG